MTVPTRMVAADAPATSTAVTLDELREVLSATVAVHVEGVGPVPLAAVSKEASLKFAGRLEKIRGAADLMGIGADMIVASAAVDGLDGDDAMRLLAVSGGIQGKLFRTAANMCGVGNFVDFVLRELEGVMGAAGKEPPAGNSPATPEAPATDGVAKTYTS